MLRANGCTILLDVACCCVFLGAVAQYFETGQTFSYMQTDTTMLRQFARDLERKLQVVYLK